MNKIGIYILLIVIGGVIGVYVLNVWMLNESAVGMNFKELKITKMEFTTLNGSDIIVVHVTNVGNSPVTVAAVEINGDTQNNIIGDSVHGLTFNVTDSGTITIEHDWTVGNNYTVNLFTPHGLISYYIDTA
jgi:hypothetical protein